MLPKQKKGSLYIKPIFISKRQHKLIGKGKMITISRQQYTLNIALKGYSDEKAKIKTQIEKLKAKLKEI